MIFDFFEDLNWLAVIVAAIAYWILGAIWYSDAVMGKQWRAAAGIEDMTPGPKQIVGGLALYFVSALTLGLISHGIGADDFGDGLLLGLVVAFGFIGTSRINEDLYTNNRKELMMVNAPYTLLGFALMGVILAIWT